MRYWGGSPTGVLRQARGRQAAKSLSIRKARPTRGKFLDHAFVVALRFKCGYRGYETERKAMAALRRRAPGFSPVRYSNAFTKALRLYTSTVSLIDLHLPTLRRDWLAIQPAGEVYDLGPLVRQLRRRAPGFLSSTYDLALNWVWYWHHLK